MNFAQFSPLQSFVLTWVHPDGQIDIYGRGISSRSSTFWCWSGMIDKSQGNVTLKIIKQLEFSPRQRTLSLASSRSHENETISRLRARLHGTGEPHEAEVTRLHDRWGDNMRDYVDRQVTPPKRVTSPAWGHPPPRKQALKAWENNWYFPTPTKVSPQNDVCGQKWDWGQKFHTADDVSPPWSRWCFWLAEASFPRGMTNQKHYTDLGSVASSVWNSCAHSSDRQFVGKLVAASRNVGCFLRLALSLRERERLQNYITLKGNRVNGSVWASHR